MSKHGVDELNVRLIMSLTGVDRKQAAAMNAAEDLLEACRKVVAAQSPEEYDEAREAADNAMQKAEGAQ